MSFDPDGCKIKYGIGHHMEETTMLEHSLNLGSEAMALFRTAPKVVSLHGYSAGPIERRSVFEAKLLTLNGHEVSLKMAVCAVSFCCRVAAVTHIPAARKWSYPA